MTADGDVSAGLSATLKPTGRLIAILAVFIGVLLIGREVVSNVPWPEIAVNAPIVLPVAAATAVTIVVSRRFLQTDPIEAYGLSMDRGWWTDLRVGLGIGLLFQAVASALMVLTGAGEIVGYLSIGVARDPVGAAIAFLAAGIGFLAVAFWEEFLFRGVLITNILEQAKAIGLKQRSGLLIGLMTGPIVFGLPHVFAVAQGASISFAAFQGAIAALYFGLAYIVTGKLALSLGIHMATNFWVACVLGSPSTGFPSLVLFERSLRLTWPTLLSFMGPTIVLFGIIHRYGRVLEDRGDRLI